MEISKRRTCVGTVVIALLLPISGEWMFFWGQQKQKQNVSVAEKEGFDVAAGSV